MILRTILMNEKLTKQALILVAATSIAFPAALAASEFEDDIMSDLSLQELFAIETDIASNTSRDINEQPSIVSVITREQIQKSGARDLVDILRMVPGFGSAHDTAGINSWGFRGIWGHEGKIMLLIDGAPHNDAAWGNVQLGHHYPVDLIKKVEVIRGPGAAKWGNYAELAVVRVSTLDGEIEGGFVEATVGTLDAKATGNKELTGMYGAETDNGKFSISAFLRRSNRTVLPFESADKSISALQDHSPVTVNWFDAKYSLNDLNVNALHETHSIVHSENMLQLPAPDLVIDQGYKRTQLGLDYGVERSDWQYNGKLLYQKTRSHDMFVKQSRDGDLAPGNHYRVDTERLILNADALYTINEKNNVIFGIERIDVKARSKAIGEYFVDPAHTIPGDSTELTNVWFGGSNIFEFYQNSAFAQFESYNDILNITLGLRYADHSKSNENVVVPRVGLSKKFGNLGIKVMYSEAFRTGDAEHLNLSSQPLKPETLGSSEIELHYAHETGFYALNYFDTRINDSIVWNTEAKTENKGEISSSGFEASWRSVVNSVEQEVTLAHYRAGENSTPSQLASDDKSYLGFPTLKVTWRLDYQVFEDTNFTSTLVYESEKWWRKDNADASLDVKIDDVLKVNLSLTNSLTPNLELQVSIHDLLDEQYYFAQAYGQVLFPGDGRELSLGLEYRF